MTSVIIGSFFDWSLHYIGLMGWNLPERKATIFDGGECRVRGNECCSDRSCHRGNVVPSEFRRKKEQVHLCEFLHCDTKSGSWGARKATGVKFVVDHKKTEDVANEGLAKSRAAKGVESTGGGTDAAGALELITLAIYGRGGLNNFSKKGLWNKELGLPKEDLEATLARVFKELERTGQ
jgi:hypothetical protein